MEVFSGSEFGGDGVGDCVYLDFWIFGVMVFSFGFGFGLCLVVWELECQLCFCFCVFNEILGIERDYVGILCFLQLVFLYCIWQNVVDLVEKGFMEENVKILFLNIEDILEVYKDFLVVLEYCLYLELQFQYEFGNVFLKFKDKFCVYEEYCSNYEKVLRLLVELNKIFIVCVFFLSCMFLGGWKIIDIFLEGYLLFLIQRICKYLFFFKELVKRIFGKYLDYFVVQSVLQVMKIVCFNINEIKWQMEKLEVLEQLQFYIEGWEGFNFIDICIQFFL